MTTPGLIPVSPAKTFPISDIKSGVINYGLALDDGAGTMKISTSIFSDSRGGLNQSVTDTRYDVARPVINDVNFTITTSSPLSQYTDFHGYDISMYTAVGDNGVNTGGVFPFEATAGFLGSAGVTLSRAKSVLGQALMDGTGGTLELGVGVQGRIQNLGSGIITDGRAFYVREASNSGGGSITNLYGLYIDNQTAGATNHAIYTNAGINYFGDEVRAKGTLSVGYGISSGNPALTLYGYYLTNPSNASIAISSTVVEMMDFSNATNGYKFDTKIGIGTTVSPTCGLEINRAEAFQAQFHGGYSGGTSTNHGAIKLGSSATLCGVVEYNASSGYLVLKNTYANANARVTLTANSKELIFDGNGDLLINGELAATILTENTAVSLLASDSTAAKLAKINALPVVAVQGVEVTFTFEASTHTESETLLFKGFKYPINVVMTGATIDGTGFDDDVLYFDCCDNVNITNGTVNGDTTTSANTMVRASGCGAVTINGTAVSGNGTGKGQCILIRQSKPSEVNSCTVSNAQNGIYAIQQRLYSANNSSTGTIPANGLRVAAAAVIGKNGTQPTGSTNNELGSGAQGAEIR